MLCCALSKFSVTPHRFCGTACSSSREIGRESSVLKSTASKVYPPGYNRSAYRSETILVSRKYRFIYVKTAKSGGTSVVSFLTATLCNFTYSGESDFLARNPCPRDVLTFVTPAESRVRADWPTEKQWMTFFVFAFVRDPLARRASITSYCQMGHWCESCGIQSHCGRCTEIHCRSQFVQLFMGSLPVVDFVGRTEKLGEDLWTVMAIVNDCLPACVQSLKLAPLGHENTHGRVEPGTHTDTHTHADSGVDDPNNTMNHSLSHFCPKCDHEVRVMYQEDYRRFRW